MTTTRDIIEINITRQTQGVSRAGFGTPLFLGLHAAYSERVRSYSSLDGVEEDFGTESTEYLAASKFFSQNPRPTIVKIGRQQADSVDFSPDVANNSTYRMTVDGVEVEFISDADATADEITAGLASAFTTAGAAGTLTDNTGTLSLVPADADDFELSFTSNLNAEYQTSESLTDAINAVQDYDNDWYFLTAYTHTSEDIQELAAWTEANIKLYFTSYAGADALDTGVTEDPGSVLSDLNYNRTAIIYSTTADTEYPEAAWVGLQSTTLSGSTTWAYKTVSGVTASNINSTQSLTLLGTKYNPGTGKGYNVYQTLGGVDVFTFGQVSSLEYIDIMRGADELEARIRERIFQILVNVGKIEYNDAGFARIVGAMRAVLTDFNARGFIEPDFEIVAPNPRTIDPNLRANRIAEGFTFTANLTSAVHFVGITGTLLI